MGIEKEKTKEMELAGVPEATLVIPEIVESFGTWMIAEWKTRRTNNRRVADQTIAVGKTGDQAKKQGESSMTVTAPNLSVSQRYEALMAIDESTEVRGEEGNKEGNEGVN